MDRSASVVRFRAGVTRRLLPRHHVDLQTFQVMSGEDRVPLNLVY